MWLNSSCLLARVPGNVSALCIRILAVLILCLMSWCELKLRYLSVCVGFLNTSVLRLLPCHVISVSKKEILLSCSSLIVKEILGSMLFKELRKLVIAVFLIMEKLSSTKHFHVFWFCLCRFNSSIFNDFHAYVSYNRTNWATHSTAMNLFVSHVVINRIVLESVKSNSEIMSSMVRLCIRLRFVLFEFCPSVMASFLDRNSGK